MSFHAEMCQAADVLSVAGVGVLCPSPDDVEALNSSPELWALHKREAAFSHVRKIRNPATFGILVMNFDKYGVRNYIGPSTFVEIAVATIHRKRVYLIADMPAVYSEELTAWGVQSLQGSLERLIADYQHYHVHESAQLSLFD